MSYEKAKKSYESYNDIHCKKFNGVISEGSYQDSILLLKNLQRDMELAGEKEGIPVPVTLWPKK
jgi:hypothetical protein